MTQPGRSRAGRAGCGILIAVCLLAAAEFGLRVIGFRFDQSVSYMEFNFPNPHELHQIFEPDPLLLWRMRTEYDFGDGFVRLNRQGFRGKDFAQLPRAGLRVACLGDSVTFGGQTADFPNLLEQKLTAGGLPAQVLNFGVPGYSSWQGRRLLRKVLAEYQPGIVIALFGWNDHWLAKGYTDLEQVVNPPPAAVSPLRQLRLYQLLNLGRARLAGGGKPKSAGPARHRVSPEEYTQNLLAMDKLCRQAGAKIVFATAPSGIGAGVVPEYLLSLGFISQPSDLAVFHARYNELTREAAARAGVKLCDLDSALERAGGPALFRDPSQDLIHPQPEGYELMAQRLAECLREGGLLPSAPGSPPGD